MNIEEQFFKTFGIEPKVKCDEIKTANICICLACPHYKNIDGDTGEFLNVEYPKITAEILLELICILSGCCNTTLEIKAKTTEKLKDGILQEAVERAYYALDKDKYRNQVRALFESEEE